MTYPIDSKLSTDCLIKVFDFLEPKEQALMQQVSKTIYIYINHSIPDTWKIICSKKPDLKKLTMYPDVSYKSLALAVRSSVALDINTLCVFKNTAMPEAGVHIGHCEASSKFAFAYQGHKHTLPLSLFIKKDGTFKNDGDLITFKYKHLTVILTCKHVLPPDCPVKEELPALGLGSITDFHSGLNVRIQSSILHSTLKDSDLAYSRHVAINAPLGLFHLE